jgi:ribose transport system permease protein
MGGEGTILGTLIGALIMGVLRTGLVLTGVSAYWLQAVQGFVIVTAIMVDQVRRSGGGLGLLRMFRTVFQLFR